MRLSIHPLPWFIHCYIPRLGPICWNILLLWVCQLPLQSEAIVSCPLLWPDWVFCSPKPAIINHLSSEYKSRMLYILTLILQLILLWVVCSTIGLKPLLLSMSLCRLWCLTPLMLLLLDLFHGPIHIFLVAFWISFCWIDVWKIKYNLVGLLDLSCLVLCQFFHCPVLYYPWPLSF